ncbi:MAG: hypothetical protein ACRDPJ_17565 [Nocardioidaceae bacterium]
MTRHPTTWLVGLALVGVALAFGVWRAGDAPATDPGSRSVTAVGSSGKAEPAALSAAGVSSPAADVLQDWDRRRAQAFARGSARGLRALYVPGSTAGTTDVALLRGYSGRGLRVEGMRMQVLSVEVLEHARNRWRLRVVDRLRGAVAVGNGAEIPLPRDQATVHVLTLQRTSPADDWKMAAVR